MPNPNETEAETAETTEAPKVEDLIAEAIGLEPEAEEEAVPDETVEAVATDEAAAEVDDTAEEATPVAAGLEDADVTKELETLGITKPDSQARFRELANEAKEGRQWRQQAEQQGEVFEHLQRNGISGEQFGGMVGYLAHRNSNDPTRLRAAFDTLAAEMQGLAKQLGIEAPGVDTLAFHPDLKRKVDDGELDRDTATAWAADKAKAEFAAKADAFRAQQDTATQSEERARQDLTALGNELQTRDPHYDRVYQVLVPTLRPVLARLPPDKWVEATADAYRDLRQQLAASGQLVAPKPAPIAKRPDPNNPGRPNGAAGGQAPKTAEAALLAQFGYSDT
jgi:hypothetical protein